MDISNESVETAESARPDFLPMPLRLTLQPGGHTVEVVNGDALVGRHSDANLRLALPDVSRRHCRLFYTDRQWRVVDLDSLNGVYVNNVRVREAVLHDRDALRIGSFVFEVDLHSKEAQPPGPADGPQRVIRDIAEVLASPPPARKAS
jgi:pSer/pThr/pTyr-binding forkhead associated (FHA) protein